MGYDIRGPVSGPQKTCFTPASLCWPQQSHYPCSIASRPWSHFSFKLFSLTLLHGLECSIHNTSRQMLRWMLAKKLHWFKEKDNKTFHSVLACKLHYSVAPQVFPVDTSFIAHIWFYCLVFARAWVVLLDCKFLKSWNSVLLNENLGSNDLCKCVSCITSLSLGFLI